MSNMPLYLIDSRGPRFLLIFKGVQLLGSFLTLGEAEAAQDTHSQGEVSL